MSDTTADGRSMSPDNVTPIRPTKGPQPPPKSPKPPRRRPKKRPAPTLQVLYSRLDDQHNRFYDAIAVVKLVAEAKRDEDNDVAGALDVAVEALEKINERLEYIAMDVETLAQTTERSVR